MAAKARLCEDGAALKQVNSFDAAEDRFTSMDERLKSPGCRQGITTSGNARRQLGCIFFLPFPDYRGNLSRIFSDVCESHSIAAGAPSQSACLCSVGADRKSSLS